MSAELTPSPPRTNESMMATWLQCMVLKRDKREQPIFTTKAHVFQIDPETKKNWIPASKQAINVSYYYDSTRNTYRIISVEGSKAIINSTITSSMTFTKTSQKFGQWSDPRANTVYGLGFSTEVDLAKFIDKFKEIKDMSRKSIAKPSEQNGTDEENTHSPERRPYHQRTSSLSTIQGDVSGGFIERRGSLTGNSSPPSPIGITEGQLKYENDRLKIALAQSSANAKKWEIELQTLKNNNARLTAALQESTANVEEWKKQLASYKEESSRMKAKVMDMEKLAGNAEQIQTLQKEIRLMTEKIESLTKEISEKEENITKFEKKVEALSEKEAQIGPLQNSISSLKLENEAKSLKIQDLQRLLDECRSMHDEEEKEVLGFQELLGRRITELYELHEQIVCTIKKESQS